MVRMNCRLEIHVWEARNDPKNAAKGATYLKLPWAKHIE